ncbi:hypothetical protein HZS_4876, partial [Henneguya salminicola]
MKNLAYSGALNYTIIDCRTVELADINSHFILEKEDINKDARLLNRSQLSTYSDVDLIVISQTCSTYKNLIKLLNNHFNPPILCVYSSGFIGL